MPVSHHGSDKKIIEDPQFPHFDTGPTAVLTPVGNGGGNRLVRRTGLLSVLTHGRRLGGREAGGPACTLAGGRSGMGGVAEREPDRRPPLADPAKPDRLRPAHSACTSAAAANVRLVSDTPLKIHSLGA